MTIDTRDVNDLGPAKFRTRVDSNQEQISYYNRNKRDTSFNSFLAVRKQTSAFNDITFSVVKLIDKTNKNANIYSEINDELSDFSNDVNKRTVQRISENNIRRETTTDRKRQQRGQPSTRTNG